MPTLTWSSGEIAQDYNPTGNIFNITSATTLPAGVAVTKVSYQFKVGKRRYSQNWRWYMYWIILGNGGPSVGTGTSADWNNPIHNVPMPPSTIYWFYGDLNLNNTSVFNNNTISVNASAKGSGKYTTRIRELKIIVEYEAVQPPTDVKVNGTTNYVGSEAANITWTKPTGAHYYNIYVNGTFNAQVWDVDAYTLANSTQYTEQALIEVTTVKVNSGNTIAESVKSENAYYKFFVDIKPKNFRVNGSTRSIRDTAVLTWESSVSGCTYNILANEIQIGTTGENTFMVENPGQFTNWVKLRLIANKTYGNSTFSVEVPSVWYGYSIVTHTIKHRKDPTATLFVDNEIKLDVKIEYSNVFPNDTNNTVELFIGGTSYRSNTVYCNSNILETSFDISDYAIEGVKDIYTKHTSHYHEVDNSNTIQFRYVAVPLNPPSNLNIGGQTDYTGSSAHLSWNKATLNPDITGEDITHEIYVNDTKHVVGNVDTFSVPNTSTLPPGTVIKIRATTNKGRVSEHSNSITYTYFLSPDKTMAYYINGDWTNCILYYYTGATWVKCEPHYYDGTKWVPVSTR